jgi:hypothetical protein
MLGNNGALVGTKYIKYELDTSEVMLRRQTMAIDRPLDLARK